MYSLNFLKNSLMFYVSYLHLYLDPLEFTFLDGMQ